MSSIFLHTNKFQQVLYVYRKNARDVDFWKEISGIFSQKIKNKENTVAILK